MGAHKLRFGRARWAKVSPVDAIKAEAGRRIAEFAPLWKQLNAERAGGADSAALFARIDAIRAASDALEAMTPIPTPDAVTSDIYWP